jgi:hypothetical protein
MIGVSHHFLRVLINSNIIAVLDLAISHKAPELLVLS